ncbi:Thioesterase [Sulfidibacter corallicola]|uniref:Thioesterase n=1 Tax=Sulfidibacter corallicola TaxID=2818388 RepID=A0A8A4TGE7_SULCO|nr:alpha/beta fold hydrolase [Sulfidibacter corallicola]QTD49149.1 thioesterase [Sulfidibacter corallicola]
MTHALTVFAFPFAGGNRFSYRELSDRLPADIRLHTFDYPGHGSRFKEAPLADLDRITEDAFNQIRAQLETPYVIYGHSMGAQVGFKVVHRLWEAGLPMPRMVMFSGRKAPENWHRDEHYHHLPKEAFFKKISDLGGCPPAFLANPELRDLFEPILRADFQSLELYEVTPSPRPLEIPIAVVTGTEEDIEPEHIANWQNETRQPLIRHQIEGGHFFIVERIEAFSTWMIETFSQCLELADQSQSR